LSEDLDEVQKVLPQGEEKVDQEDDVKTDDLEKKEIDDFEKRKYLLSKVRGCFINTIREITYEILKGRILLPDNLNRKIFRYKVALTKICEPRVSYKVARQRVERWNEILPNLIPVWWECLYLAWGVLTCDAYEKSNGVKAKNGRTSKKAREAEQETACQEAAEGEGC
jgi:5-methylcytosine-specific restriction endonuclease McrA